MAAGSAGCGPAPVLGRRAATETGLCVANLPRREAGYAKGRPIGGGFGIPDVVEIVRDPLRAGRRLHLLESRAPLAQAVYLHTGPAGLAVPEYTTDADIALDPAFLADTPKLADAMEAAGFTLGKADVGKWVAKRALGGRAVEVVDGEGAGRGRGLGLGWGPADGAAQAAEGEELGFPGVGHDLCRRRDRRPSARTALSIKPLSTVL
jgi:hypothetical protein